MTGQACGISAKIIADSISPSGIRLTTMELTYHRFIHSEFMTHRMFSRNASSSRAIPVEKMLKHVKQHPALPVYWGKNQPGMQAREELTQEDLEEATEIVQQSYKKKNGTFAEFPNWWYSFVESHEGFDEFGGGSYQQPPKTVKEVLEEEWERFGFEACENATELNTLGLHKQITNRLLEPFQWISVVVTATEWDNFFKLRLHKDAQPEMMVLAEHMKKAMDESIPTKLIAGEWHLPYVTELERNKKAYSQKDINNLIKCSIARCARVSYLNHDNSNPSIGKDIALADMLVEAGHMSPLEHQLTPMEVPKDNYNFEKGVTHIDRYGWKWSGNSRAWYQYRHLI